MRRTLAAVLLVLLALLAYIAAFKLVDGVVRSHRARVTQEVVE